MRPVTIVQGMPKADKLELVIHGDFILGLPGETRETINNTVAFAKELDVENIQVSVAQGYPGTELYDVPSAANVGVGDVERLIPPDVVSLKSRGS